MASGSPMDRATAPTLMAPDVSVNFAIVDDANSGPARAQALAGELLGKLSSPNPKVAHLAVIVADALARNGNGAVHEALAEVGIGGILATLSSKHSSSSLGKVAAALLQALGVAYAAASGPPLSTLASAYAAAKLAGTSFPFADDSLVPADIKPVALTAAAAAASGVPLPLPGTDANDKLLAELDTVRGWIGECARLVGDAGGSVTAMAGSSGEEAFLDVLDRLEQCPDRLLRLIESGMQGRLDDACLGSALEVQSALGELLPWAQGSAAITAEQASALLAMGAPASPSAARDPTPSAGGSAGFAGSAGGAEPTRGDADDLGDLFGSAPVPAPAVTAAAAEAPPGPSIPAGTLAASSAPPVAAATAAAAPEDAAPFDDFDPRGGALAPQTSYDSDFDAPPPEGGGSAAGAADSFNPRAGEPVAAAGSDEAAGGGQAGTAPAPGAASEEDLADFEAFLEAQDASK